MEWTLSHDAQVAMLMEGGVAVRPSSFTDERVRALRTRYQSYPFMQILQLPLLMNRTHSVATPTIPEADEIVRVVSAGLSRILAGDVAAGTGLNNIASQLREILQAKSKLRYPVARKLPAD
jgi:ABC-type glycerol-3-phosphate transport system substrate-binding protein